MRYSDTTFVLGSCLIMNERFGGFAVTGKFGERQETRAEDENTALTVSYLYPDCLHQL